jgi:2,3-dihydroxy-2,3-dihydro-p-cumate dehydrogenase
VTKVTVRRLQNKTAIITGTARGLGVALATRYGAEGARVLLVDVNGETLPAVAEAVMSAGAPDVTWVAQDLSREEGARAAVDLAVDRWGRVDVLLNNAGGGVIRPFLEHTPETLKATLDRNLWTVLWCCRAALPKMIAQKHGRIINIGADSVRTGLYSHSAYNAAKGGVNGLTTGLAREFAKDGITVNTISPGGILTDEVRQMLQQDSAAYQKHRIIDIRDIVSAIPVGRFCEMSEVASLAAYLACDEAAFITGQVISINGGQWMQ